MKITLLSLLFIVAHLGYAQDLVKDRVLEEKVGYSNPSSSTSTHLRKQGTTFKLEDYACNLNYKDSTNNFYTVNHQADLVYFEKFDTIKSEIIESGYYRLVYKDSNYGYCWEKDLVWFAFRDGKVIQREFYSKGIKSDSFITR